MMSIRKSTLGQIPRREAKSAEKFLARAASLCCNLDHRKSHMRTIICLFVFLAFASGVHADDKKKKKPAANNAPVKALGGSGGGGPMHMPNISHGNASHGLGQTGQGSGTPHVHSLGGPSATNPLSTHATTASGKTGQAHATGQSSNPLLRKGGQAGPNGQSSNPLTHANQHAGAMGAHPGAKSTNPLANKGAAQPGMNGRNAANLTGKNHAAHSMGAASTITAATGTLRTRIIMSDPIGTSFITIMRPGTTDIGTTTITIGWW
jgi:hypothetical protein